MGSAKLFVAAQVEHGAAERPWHGQTQWRRKTALRRQRKRSFASGNGCALLRRHIETRNRLVAKRACQGRARITAATKISLRARRYGEAVVLAPVEHERRTLTRARG